MTKGYRDKITFEEMQQAERLACCVFQILPHF